MNDVERGYRVKLFLEQFGVKACVVNAELPLASRYHAVEEFNRGIYDVVVATDESTGTAGQLNAIPEPKEKPEVIAEEHADGPEDVEPNGVDVATPEVIAEAGPSKRRREDNKHGRSKRRKDQASSMARGIDFTSASSVINFDLPTSSTAYLHRVGRTARAGHSGLALSFIVPQDKWGKDKGVSVDSAKNDETVWSDISLRVKGDSGADIKEWDWGGKKSEIEGFRYRMGDALRAVTGKRVAEAKREEVKRELLNSEKLKVCRIHFCGHPY